MTHSEDVGTIVLGAGPAGLAAGYTLAKAGRRPLVLERDKVCGGLMRSIHRGEFVVDVGRKELYNRLEKVDALWREILGTDYRDYPHRGGILYNGVVMEMSPAFAGFRRAMPWPMLLGCAWDFLKTQMPVARKEPRSLEEFFYRQRGRRLTQVFSQGFQEKLSGTKWAEVPLPDDALTTEGEGAVQTVKQLLQRLVSTKEVNTFHGIWKHPARGTGQICDLLARGIVDHGGRIEYQAKLLGMDVSGTLVQGVTAEIGGNLTTYRPTHVVSSIPIEFVLQYLFPDRAPATASQAPPLDPRRRTVVLVYLFLNETPRFPHAWLQVTCPSTRIGRIANYSGFNGEMVPQGKSALCCEYYCFGDDALLAKSNEDLVAMTAADLTRFGLIAPDKVFDQLVLRLPGADASQNRDNWMSEARLAMMGDINRFENLFYVNRTETDIATLAGMEAAEAILSGDRTDFDRRIDPAQLQIRSDSKAFEFKNPLAAR